MTTTESFLIDGAESYIDALAAIKAFEKAVLDVCRKVYNKNQPQLVSTIGLQDTPCEDHYDNHEPENRYAELGVWQNSPSDRETLYVYLRWDVDKDGAPEISACVCLDFTTKSDRNEYGRLLRKIPSILRGDGWYPYLWSSKKLSDLSSCAEALDGLLNEWLECWPADQKLQ